MNSLLSYRVLKNSEDIIQYRKENGSFQKIEDIKKISGIKDAAFNKIKELICV